jgi:tetratricopeptide (TPR) repeat protein
MKALRNLIIFLVIIVAAGFLIPVDLRNGYFFNYYGQIIEATSNDLGAAAAAYKDSSAAMPSNGKFARAYVRAINDIGSGAEAAGNSEKYYSEALQAAEDWLAANKGNKDEWQLLVEQARAEWGLGKKNAAKVSIDKAVNIRPTDYTALVYQGIIWRDMQPHDNKEIGKCVSVFNQAIEVRKETRTAWAHYELAVAYRMMRDDNASFNEVNQALAQWPDRALREKLERLKHDIESSGRSEK